MSLAINQKRLSARWDLKLSADVDKIIAFDHLFGQGENPTKSRSQFVHNWSIRQRIQKKVLFCGKMNKKIEIALQIRENVLS
ncbi:MAG: hypothetical protein ACLRO1_03895 [Agathobaculum sp.]